MILHTIIDYSTRGGAEMMLARIINAARDEDVMLISLMGFSEDNLSLIEHPNIKCEALGMRRASDGFSVAVRLSRIIAREKPTAILCWLYHAGAIAALAGLMAGFKGRTVLTVRGALDDYKTVTYSAKVAILAASLLMWRIDGIIYNSARAIEYHARIGFRNSHSAVIHNGLSLPPPRASRSLNATVIGMAGRFHIDKDYETFFAAAALVASHYPTTTFIVAGRNVTLDNPDVLAMIERSGLPKNRLRLYGELQEMRPFYEQLDICVLSSRTEGFPNVVLEAMSYGIPCAATDVGDVKTLIADTGEVVTPQDPQSLADGIERLLALSSKQFTERGRAARARVEQQFDIHTVAKMYNNYVRYGRI